MSNPTLSPGLVCEATGGFAVTRSNLSEDDILAAAETIIERRYVRIGQLYSVTETKQFLRSKLITRKEEAFVVVFLDNHHRVIAYEELFFGSINGATVHPRQVVKRALHHNAAAVVLSHNHPSGNACVSEADRRITAELVRALGLIEVRVIDHVVIGFDEMVSFAERGLL